MAIVFGYTPATNTVVVTGGTAGVPATFADFVTADRAGNYTVMDAIATAMNLTLDRLIRPVELRALKITFTLAGTNAGAGDTVDITGTDAWGNAQTESINVAAGNGAYVSAKYWRTITDIDCTGFADGIGTIDAVQSQWGVIWDYGNGQYLVDALFDIGDGIAATYFVSIGESVVLTTSPQIKASATLQIGAKSNTWSGKGSYWEFPAGGFGRLFCSLGSFEMYGSILKYTSSIVFVGGDYKFYNSIINGGTTPLDWSTSFVLFTGNSLYISALYVFNITTFQIFFIPDLVENYHSENCKRGVEAYNATTTITNPRITNWVNDEYTAGATTGILNVIDPVNNITDPFVNVGIGNFIYEKYTCNIHVADKDGVNVQNAVVACEDQFGVPIFSVNTDVNGNIVEQLINYKIYNDGDNVGIVCSPHKFTISRAGYETMELDGVTVDVPIVWHLELLPALAASDVRDGLSFLEDRIGSLDLPSINDVEDGVFFDNATKEGNFEAPAEEDVEVGVGYGSLGTEFEGTYLGLRGENLTAVLEESVALVGHLEKKVDLTGELAP